MSGTSGTVRPDADLLNEFRDQQAPGSITPADMRDLVVSLTEHIKVITATSETANYTLALGDEATVIEVNSASAVTVTVPTSSAVPFDAGCIIQVCQFGAGQVTIAPAGGVTLRTPTSLVTRVQYSQICLRQRATDDWVVSGDLA